MPTLLNFNSMKEKLEYCSSLFNRSYRQTEHLYNLFNKELYILMMFEIHCKLFHIVRCPNNLSEAEEIWHIKTREEEIDGKEMV